MNRRIVAVALAALAAGGCAGGDKADVADRTDEPAAAVTGLDQGFGTKGVKAVPLSAGDGDRLVTVVAGKDGKTYASGYVAQAGDQAMTVARFDAGGSLDTSFSGDGVATVNVAVGGKAVELGRGLGLQSSGKVLVGGPVEHDPSAAGDAAKDTDIAVSRFGTDGALDPSFGSAGTARVDLGPGLAVSETEYVNDVMWGLRVLPDDRVLAVAAGRAAGAGRTDRDMTLVMLTKDGAVDTTFGTAGKLVVDVGGGTESPRTALVQPDGKLVAAGYTRSPGENPVVSPMLVRFGTDGKLDPSFGTGGIASAQLLPAVGEAYDVALQGDDYVITGYGRATADEKVDLIVARFTGEGAWDKSFGTGGLVRLDIAKEDDRGRDVAVLADGRIIVAGSGKPAADNIEGMIVLLGKDGAPEPAFGTGGHLLVDLGAPWTPSSASPRPPTVRPPPSSAGKASTPAPTPATTPSSPASPCPDVRQQRRRGRAVSRPALCPNFVSRRPPLLPPARPRQHRAGGPAVGAPEASGREHATWDPVSKRHGPHVSGTLTRGTRQVGSCPVRPSLAGTNRETARAKSDRGSPRCRG